MNQQLNNLLEVGEIVLEDGISGHHILFLSIIGEIEGHNLSSERIKTTKYEHLLPILAKAQDSEEIEGIFFLINTVGGDCSCGLAVAEMIASIKKPTVSLIIGDSHSIGAPQTFEYFKLIQDRILKFVEAHTGVTKSRIERMMLRQGMMVKDLGTILVGEMAVKEGLIHEVGGISEALFWLHQEIERRRKRRNYKN